MPREDQLAKKISDASISQAPPRSLRTRPPPDPTYGCHGGDTPHPWWPQARPAPPARGGRFPATTFLGTPGFAHVIFIDEWYIHIDLKLSVAGRLVVMCTLSYILDRHLSFGFRKVMHICCYQVLKMYCTFICVSYDHFAAGLHDLDRVFFGGQLSGSSITVEDYRCWRLVCTCCPIHKASAAANIIFPCWTVFW
jgi:hypothetical protein